MVGLLSLKRFAHIRILGQVRSMDMLLGSVRAVHTIDDIAAHHISV